MTCPCIEMREKAATVCDELNEQSETGDYMTMAAENIRALPLCGRCDTHVLVPKEPTEKMKVDAGDIGDGFGLTSLQICLIYKSMLAAAREEK